MNALGWLCYWLGRIAGFFRENLWRGWEQLYRCDYDAPIKWRKPREWK